jgi:2'-hydroxyisoflavone reductase
MRILVLGGTSFIGRAIVSEALLREHDLTLFSRGRTGSELFPEATRLVGDRDTGDYAALVGGTWDAVVDVTAYVPRHVAQATRALDHQGRWLLISTGSVYDKDRGWDGMTEDAPRVAPERESEDVTAHYGALKVACEDDVLELFGERATIVRPGIVGGPHDPSDRLTWWVRRASRGGRVALPARPDQPIQVVDASDLARLVVSLLEDDRPGTFNAVGPSLPLAQLVERCAHATGAEVEVVAVTPGPELPLVVPDESWDPMFRRSPDAALEAGLTVTPYEQTAVEVHAWDLMRGEPPLALALDPEREAELLAAG